ncbi:hypothetical protein BDF21DRAFT_452295 [Thamnidium elegans]|uniref:Uncharacterized protein n=1 Tax=Thamnidium elegans TaxID=101142 RepID=A0A8H7SZ62_9FUNG|nr:hypothetical protein INT48_009654 [Thamnidium elegans]KAI8080570.1 hypothetical protein BDF21DRAFT_452295 [Thamnidium elegans]
MSINQTKAQLTEAIGLYNHLKAELDNKNNLEAYSENEWQTRIRNLGLEAAKLIHLGRILDDDHLIKNLNYKQKKLKRHGNWQKRHRKRVQQIRRQRLKRNEKWIKDIEWRVTMTPSNLLKTINNKSILQETGNEPKDKLKIKEFSRILSKLTQLRNLRRKKLEAKGHFFADDGNQFFNQVKKWHESNQKEQQRLEEEEYGLIKEEQKPSKKLTVHKQDVWRHMSIDKTAYRYWCESDQSLEALLRNRRLWDQYIITDSKDNDLIHKVPPTFIPPPPPANWIWASYLL